MNILHLGNPFFLQDFRQLGHDVKWAAYDRTADFVLSPYVESLHSLSAQFPARWFPDLVVVGMALAVLTMAHLISKSSGATSIRN